MAFTNIFTPTTLVKASSGLSKEARSLVDGSSETSWTSAGSASAEANPSTVKHELTLTLREDGDSDADSDDEQEDGAPSVRLDRLHEIILTFQGGYSAMEVVLLAQVQSDGATHGQSGEWVKLETFWPEDSNARQHFAIRPAAAQASSDKFKLELRGSTDSFGRVTLYGVELNARQA